MWSRSKNCLENESTGKLNMKFIKNRKNRKFLLEYVILKTKL